MSDEVTGVMPTEGGENPQAEQQATQAQPQPGETPDIAQLQAQMAQMQDALKRANREAADRRKKLDEYESAEIKRKEAELSETERLSKRLAEAESRAKEAQNALMRRDVAAKHNIPSALIDRLRGDTLEELEEDAKSLASILPRQPAPNINGAAGNGRVPGTGAMSDEEIRELANVLNVNPKYLKP